MRHLNRSFLSPVVAQSATADAVAQPTFTTSLNLTPSTPAPAASPPVTTPPASTQSASINLEISGNQNNLRIGDQFETKILLDSSSELVSSYTIIIEYDPTAIEIVDQDTQLPGAQITYSHPNFTVIENRANNTTGILTLRAETGSPSAAADLEIGDINFRVTGNGATEISVSLNQSFVTNNTSQNILATSSSAQVSVSQTGQNTGTTVDNTPIIPVANISELPKSDLPFSGALYVILGTMLIALGLMGRRISNSTKSKR